MKAKLVTYTKDGLSNSERSLVSKKLYGYIDKSNKGGYKYIRKGLLSRFGHIKVSNNTFIIKRKDWPKIEKFLKGSKAKIKSWGIDIRKSYLKS